jgi:hypothetical protein
VLLLGVLVSCSSDQPDVELATGEAVVAAASVHMSTDSTYEQQLEAAISAWEKKEAFTTTLIRDSDVPEISIWKTVDRMDDGTEGIAPIVRARLKGGDRVMVLGRSEAHPEQWKVTNGRMVGWVSHTMLEFTPDYTAMPDPRSLRGGNPIQTISDFENSEFCRAYQCRPDGEWNLREGGTNHTYKIAGDSELSIEVQSAASRVLGAGLSIDGRSKFDDGRTRLKSNDEAFANAFVGAFTGNECSEAQRLVIRNLTRSYEQIMQAPAANCGTWEVRAGQILNPVVSLDRVE